MRGGVEWGGARGSRAARAEYNPDSKINRLSCSPRWLKIKGPHAVLPFTGMRITYTQPFAQHAGSSSLVGYPVDVD